MINEKITSRENKKIDLCHNYLPNVDQYHIDHNCELNGLWLLRNSVSSYKQTTIMYYDEAGDVDP